MTSCRNRRISEPLRMRSIRRSTFGRRSSIPPRYSAGYRQNTESRT